MKKKGKLLTKKSSPAERERKEEYYQDEHEKRFIIPRLKPAQYKDKDFRRLLED